MTVVAEQAVAAPAALGERRLRWVVIAVVGLAGFTLMLMRRPGGVTQPGLWAEDGSIFLHDALTRPFPSALVTSYAGSLMVIPRAVAAFAAWLPLGWTPTVYAVAGVAMTTAGMLPALSRRLDWLIPSFTARCALFGLLVALPNVDEVHGTVVNAMWYFAITLVILALSRDPRTCPGRWTELGALVAVGLTGPMSILSAPLFWLRAARERTRHSITAAAVISAAALLQAAVVVISHAPAGRPGWPAPNVFGDVWGLRLGGTVVLGQQTLWSIWTAGLLHGAFWVLSAAALVLVCLALLRLPRPAAALLALAMVIAVLSATYRLQLDLAALGDPALGGRYLVIPMGVIAVLLVAAVTRSFVDSSLRLPVLSRALVVIPALMLVLATVLDFRLPGRPDINWAQSVRCVQSHRTCTVPLDPRGFTTTLPPL